MERSLLSQLISMQCNLFHIPFYLYKDHTILEAFEPSPCSCDLIAPWLLSLTKGEEDLSYYL